MRRDVRYMAALPKRRARPMTSDGPVSGTEDALVLLGAALIVEVLVEFVELVVVLVSTVPFSVFEILVELSTGMISGVPETAVASSIGFGSSFFGGFTTNGRNNDDR